ncbi:uncharacterized protein LOC141700103 [Apium graveolens]|uniref:uncharacterized protein LOC141700103 n=1 Tax=Apium graveolens TaxID=4045 RepID=UPI003D7B135E
MVLHSKHVNLPVLCSCCHIHVEDAVHTLFNFRLAKEVWNSVGLQELVRNTTDDNVMTVLKRIFNAGDKDTCVMVGLFCWNLWSRRNKWVWEEVNSSVFGIKVMALNLVADWRRDRQVDKVTRRDGQGQLKTWSKPPEGWIKINVDATYRQGGEQIGVGCVVRDDRGQFLRARTNILHGTRQVRETEAWSLREALEWVRPWRGTKCIFESDAKLLVDTFNNDRGNSNFDTIVEECSHIIRHFENVSISFVSRSANMVSHLLAQASCSMTGPMEWYHTAPEFISCNIILEEI